MPLRLKRLLGRRAVRDRPTGWVECRRMPRRSTARALRSSRPLSGLTKRSVANAAVVARY